MVRGHWRQVYFIDLRQTGGHEVTRRPGDDDGPATQRDPNFVDPPPFHAVDLMPYGLASEDPDRDRECDCD